MRQRLDAHSEVVTRLHAKSGAARWQVSVETFVETLQASLEHRWGDGLPSRRERDEYLERLAVEDLALACACRSGHEGAWEHFVRELRPPLYAAARTIAGEQGRELADGLYADLFGLSAERADRRSLLAYYHGRSRLSTWLRAVLARRHIDRLRATERLDPLPEGDELTGSTGAMPPASVEEPGRSTEVRATQDALDRAVDALDATDRLRLRLYYGSGLTLAAIGRLTAEHEATVSRKLERARRQLRDHVRRVLREAHGLDEDAIRDCFTRAADAPELHLDRLLASGDKG